MKFQWPELLWLLLAVPAMVALYLALLRRRKRSAVRYADLALFKQAMGPGQRIRRHLPPALFLVALIGMIVALARPTAVISLPSNHKLVILAMDVSGSMRATDVAPSRIVAAQEAARAFIADQPVTSRIGIVSFAAAASVVQVPTNDREAAFAAIDRFQLQKGTAIGSGILVALKLIFPELEFDLRSPDPRRTEAAARAGAAGPKAGRKQDLEAPHGAIAQGERRAQATAPASEPTAAAKRARPGSYETAAIVLLSDGQTTAGPDAIEAARMAADRGVRVFTVGIGTTKGEVLGSEGWSMRVRLDEDALKSIAAITRGEYFHAGSADDLTKVYRTLNSKLVFEKKETEITALFSAVSAALMLAAAALSIVWFARTL